jgi:DNA-binding transcriptional LysR family regulator
LALLYVASAFDEKNISIEGHLRQRGYRFTRKYAFDSFATVKRLATRGLGIAVLPTRLAAEDVKAKRLHPLRLAGFVREGFGTHRIYASFSDRSQEDQRLRSLFRLLKEHLN